MNKLNLTKKQIWYLIWLSAVSAIYLFFICYNLYLIAVNSESVAHFIKLLPDYDHVVTIYKIEIVKNIATLIFIIVLYLSFFILALQKLKPFIRLPKSINNSTTQGIWLVLITIIFAIILLIHIQYIICTSDEILRWKQRPPGLIVGQTQEDINNLIKSLKADIIDFYVFIFLYLLIYLSSLILLIAKIKLKIKDRINSPTL